jgi:hypothetical protein
MLTGSDRMAVTGRIVAEYDDGLSVDVAGSARGEF